MKGAAVRERSDVLIDSAVDLLPSRNSVYAPGCQRETRQVVASVHQDFSILVGQQILQNPGALPTLSRKPLVRQSAVNQVVCVINK